MFISHDSLRQVHRVFRRTRRARLQTFLATIAAFLMGLGAISGVSAAIPPLEPGVPVTGVLTADDPTLDDGTHYDTYAFYGHTGEVVRFYLSSNELDPYLLLVDSTGETIAEDDDSGSGTDALLEVMLPAEGTYEVLVNTFLPGSTGAYVLAWEAPTAPFLVGGEAVEGELTAEDPRLPDDTYHDAYLLIGWEGEVVRLQLSSPEVDAHLVLADAEGDWLAIDDDSGGGTDAFLEYTLPSSGAYRVLANSVFPEETGRYTLVWDNTDFSPFATQGSLEPGATLEGELTTDDLIFPDDTYYDLYSFEGRQNQSVRLRLSSREMDSFLMIFDSDGGLVTTDDDSGGGLDALIDVVLPADGVYSVMVNTIGQGETGRYTLTWEEAGSAPTGAPSAPSGPLSPHGDLRPGTSVEGNLTPDDDALSDDTYYDVHYLEGHRGETVRLRLSSPDFDAYLMLGDEQGRRLASDDDGGGGTDALLVFTLPADGRYQVVANSAYPEETGRYTLSWEAAGSTAEPNSSSLSPGVPVQGRLTSNHPILDDHTHYIAYSLMGDEGQIVRLRLSSSEMDVYLMLCDEAGNVIASDDDSGGGTDAFLEFTLPSSGLYLVVANTVFPGETGAYTLIWEATGAAELMGSAESGAAGSASETDRVDGALIPGSALAGSTGPAPDHYRTYTLDVPEGVGSVVLTLQSKGDLDLFVRYGQQMRDWENDPDHSSVTPSSSEQIVISQDALRPGRYYIDVGDLVRESLGNTFVLLATLRPEGDASEPTASIPPPEYVDDDLAPGNRIEGRIDPGFLVRYWGIDVPPGARTMEVGLFNAAGPLDLVAAPEGGVPITPDTFPYAAKTALHNDRLTIPVDRDDAQRWWIGVVSREFTAVEYELEARFDEPLPPYPTYEPQAPAVVPLEQAIAATVQLSTSMGTGSGSLVSPTGLILTNFHVVGSCVSAEPAFACGEGEVLTEPDGSPERVVVGLSDATQGVAEQLFYARLERSLLEYDLALLRIESDLNGNPPLGPLPWVPLDAGNVRLGEEVVVIGYPGIARTGGRIPLSLTRGIVSGFTSHRGERLLIQTDATVNSGNSGGLMIRTENGRVIGVPSDVQYNTETLEKQNYARPVALLPDSWRRLIEDEGGRVIEP